MTEIKAIRVLMPYKLGSVNCYLINNGSSYILIDTGSSNRRSELEQELENAGCKPGNLKLIILTHGDFDHIGNAAYLRLKFDSQIAMHIDDLEMAEHGNMFANRKQPNILIRTLISLLSRFDKKDWFKPDLFIKDGQDFSAFDFDAAALSIPGHSKGSIGILTTSGNLFCGDLFENQKKPSLNSIMDDLTAANASVEKLKNFEIKTIYPGHGEPFLMEQFMSQH
jgi:glyoxylase-like metal-dependent hydrolase (beta-lactamase superfamily II)